MTDLRKAAEALRLAEILSDGNAMDCLEHSADAAAELRRLHEENEALRQALAQPEQEPVAWVTFNAYGEEDDVWYENPEGKLLDGWTYKPLYTAPPKQEWIGLTDEEVEAFKQSCHLSGLGYDSFIKRFAIGIEAKLKEKNT